MRVAELIGAVALQAVCEATAVDVRSDAVEYKVADRVRDEVKCAVAGEGRQLKIETVYRFLQRNYRKGILFRLFLAEHRRIEIADTKSGEPRHLPRIVRDLISVCGIAEDRGDACLCIEHRRGVTEEVTLISPIVDRVVAIGRVFNAEIAGEAAPADKIFRRPHPTAIFEGRRQRAEAAAIDADATALFECIAALGLDIDDAGGAKSELRRQRTGNQCETAGKSGIQNMAEARNTIGQCDAIDAVLHVGMLVAHMDFATRG